MNFRIIREMHFVYWFDRNLIQLLQLISQRLTRLAIFIVYFWFGILKVLGESPANPLVSDLLKQTLPFLTLEQFIIYFGLFEMIIGVLFLVPRLERLAIFFFATHLLTIFAPLVVLPVITWQQFMIPTLEGQYIIKNLITIALVCSFATHLTPLKKKA